MALAEIVMLCGAGYAIGGLELALMAAMISCTLALGAMLTSPFK